LFIVIHIQKTDSSSRLLDPFATPPPIPHKRQSVLQTPETRTSPKLDVTKPLPPILPNPIRGSAETDTSLVLVEAFPVAQETAPKHQTSSNGTVTPKRRSMSVSDAELKKLATTSSATSPLPPTPNPRQQAEDRQVERWEDSALHNIIDQFKGELSQLESNSGTTLDLHDPSTPARQETYRRVTRESAVSRRMSQDDIVRHGKKKPEPDGTVVPPRTSSLQLPNRLSEFANVNSSPRPNHLVHSPGLLKPRAGPSRLGSPREANRLRTLHRSTASSSEPSLLPIIDDARARMRKHAFRPLFPV
jgi:hypothetical protein